MDVPDLEDKRRGPDGDEDAAAVKSGEYVGGRVDLASVDLVEQRHHDEHVEDERVVLGRRAQVLIISTAVDVQQPLTFSHAAAAAARTDGWQRKF